MSNQIMLATMLSIAAKAHEGQFDKAGKPYMLHVLEVMRLVASEDEELNCIAVGHDLFEDTKVTAQQLLSYGFTQRVVSGIQAMTKTPGISYAQYKEQVKANPDSVIVKKADLRHNSCLTRLRGVTEKDLARTEKYIQFYNELKSI